MSGEIVLMSLFHESTQTADAIDQLSALGIADENIVVMTGVPFPENALGRHSEWIRLPYIVLVGALVGFLFGVFLAVVTPNLYPLVVGGRPVVTGPPSFVIIYVFTMMATIVSTFLGVLWEMGFPSFERKYYDKLTTGGHLTVVFRCPEANEEEAVSILETHGGHHIRHPEKMPL